MRIQNENLLFTSASACRLPFLVQSLVYRSFSARLCIWRCLSSSSLLRIFIFRVATLFSKLDCHSTNSSSVSASLARARLAFVYIHTFFYLFFLFLCSICLVAICFISLSFCRFFFVFFRFVRIRFRISFTQNELLNGVLIARM